MVMEMNEMGHPCIVAPLPEILQRLTMSYRRLQTAPCCQVLLLKATRY